MDKSYKILLIEPDRELASIIMGWLEHHPVHLVHLVNNSNAQNHLVADQWDLVVADIPSAKISDLDTTKALKKTDPATSILIMAENIKVDFILTAMEYHADALIFKPLNKNEFVSKVLQLAKDSRRKREKKDNHVVLAIGAHPDDVEIGCAGTLAKYRENGSKINILTLSSGSMGGKPSVRKKEAEKAARILGASLFWGDLEDTKIADTANTIKKIEDVINQIAPTHVYTHSGNDNHQDHRATFNASIAACRQVSNLFCYLSPSSTVHFRPNTFIDIDDFIDIKLKVIAEFKSQTNLRMYLQSDMITSTARYWGRFCNYHLAEPMEVLKEYS